MGIVAEKGKTFHCQVKGCNFRSKSLTSIKKHYSKVGHTLKKKPPKKHLTHRKLTDKGLLDGVQTDDFEAALAIVTILKNPWQMRQMVDEMLEDVFKKKR
ncbi:unnamed protein product [marine sediment metagenome]|uniref:Uncharacterized protein n=1 Tax=marine sediment metagenome TaxID=412755 RepID=X1AY57_9ZZZZ